MWLICNWQWVPSGKGPTSRGRGRGEDIGYFKKEKSCRLFRFVTLEIPDKMKLHPSALEKACYTAWNSQDQKPRLSSAPLVIPILFLIDLWNFRSIIFQCTPKKFQVFNPPPRFGIFCEEFQIAMPLL